MFGQGETKYLYFLKNILAHPLQFFIIGRQERGQDFFFLNLIELSGIK